MRPAHTSSTEASATSATTSPRIRRWLPEPPRVCCRSVVLTSDDDTFSAGTSPAMTPTTTMVKAANSAARTSMVVWVSPS